MMLDSRSTNFLSIPTRLVISDASNDAKRSFTADVSLPKLIPPPPSPVEFSSPPACEMISPNNDPCDRGLVIAVPSLTGHCPSLFPSIHRSACASSASSGMLMRTVGPQCSYPIDTRFNALTVRGILATTSAPLTIRYASLISSPTKESNFAANCAFPTRGDPKLYIRSDLGLGGGVLAVGVPSLLIIKPEASEFHQGSDGSSCGKLRPASIPYSPISAVNRVESAPPKE
mmetsp:Transcript_6182/g.9123  ORF Transcript_6182/g.9123 Transcript_6182/m.9123 type:complete len:230 (+) Transcript_6182:246-935(+)